LPTFPLTRMITVKIPEFKYSDRVILHQIEQEFAFGKTHGVVGLNGAGKTTFFQLLAGFLKAPNCTMLLDGKPLQRKDIAYIDTDLFFYPKLSAKEFLSVFPQSNPHYKEEQLADLFRLPLEELVEEFSTGMKKKLLFLSQIKQDKAVYILDEPFNGLDLETNKLMEVIIALLNSRGKTVFISSHILDPLLNICSGIYHIKEQTILKSYSKEQFGSIAEELFGNYTRSLQEELGKMI
jgi:ABC-2 type transport system ATP-binding protein